MNQEKLNIFIRLVQKTQKQPSQTFDLGLIVKEPESKISSAKILEVLKKTINIEEITYDKSSIDESVIEKIIDIFEKGRWIFLKIKKDIGSPLLNQLKHLANFNSLQLFDYKGKALVEIKMPKNCRIIVFSERDFIENKISYPHFYRLFGPTLNIE